MERLEFLELNGSVPKLEKTVSTDERTVHNEYEAVMAQLGVFEKGNGLAEVRSLRQELVNGYEDGSFFYLDFLGPRQENVLPENQTKIQTTLAQRFAYRVLDVFSHEFAVRFEMRLLSSGVKTFSLEEAVQGNSVDALKTQKEGYETRLKDVSSRRREIGQQLDSRIDLYKRAHHLRRLIERQNKELELELGEIDSESGEDLDLVMPAIHARRKEILYSLSRNEARYNDVRTVMGCVKEDITVLGEDEKLVNSYLGKLRNGYTTARSNFIRQSHMKESAGRENVLSVVQSLPEDFSEEAHRVYTVMDQTRTAYREAIDAFTVENPYETEPSTDDLDSLERNIDEMIKKYRG